LWQADGAFGGLNLAFFAGKESAPPILIVVQSSRQSREGICTPVKMHYDRTELRACGVPEKILASLLRAAFEY
jgi:hypothetical protein